MTNANEPDFTPTSYPIFPPPLAFPVKYTFHGRQCVAIGLTKREYLAARALQGMLAGNRVCEVSVKGKKKSAQESLVLTAIYYADTMLKELGDE